ncbi:MAG: terpene cyclase/mutase family protein [Planctomycetaceae bacterium]|nr:terpene cyclase/mutase family protein [Planctomycetaceae bacterium]
MTGTIIPAASQSPPPAAAVASDSRSDRSDSVSGRPGEVSARPHNWRGDPRVAVLLSAIFHTLLLLLLTLFAYRQGDRSAGAILARQGQLSEVVAFESVRSDSKSNDAQSMVEQPVAVNIGVVEVTPVPSPIESRPAETDLALQELGSDSMVTNQATLIRLPGGGLSGRTPEGRIELGDRYGATTESEQAVEMALEWLARHQRPNGSWSFNLELDPCNGQCRHSKRKGSDTPTPATGATGLALLAFLGAGHTHYEEGPYQENVRQGIYYLRSVAAEAVAGYDWQQGSMYGHGIALMALSEALAMSRKAGRSETDLMELVQRGAAFTTVAQHSSGSWGYVPGSPGDTTLTGWQVLSLIAARRNRVDLRTNTLPDAKAFIESTSDDPKYWFGYKGPPGEPTTTAVGLTLMLYLGESPDYTPFYLALTDLARRGPKLNNIYHDYYGTLALHHSRHHDWDQWNTRLRDHLVATQATSGHERGSWHFQDRWGDIGGRLYTTAMCAMTLEVYYRYLPLYESIDEFPF